MDEKAWPGRAVRHQVGSPILVDGMRTMKSGAGSGGKLGGKSRAKPDQEATARKSAAAVDMADSEKAGDYRDCDPIQETAVLLDTVIHDLRTPLSAMSGWLEVLEAHFGAADGIVGRALLGLRRGVDSQSQELHVLSDVLMKQRIDLPADGDCLLLERIQLALKHMDVREDSPLGSAESARLQPFRVLDAAGTLHCRDGGTSLGDACGTLLHALAITQGGRDGPMAITAGADKVLITIPGTSGEPAALQSLCLGLQGYSTRRPAIRAQALWLARSILQRCGLALRMNPAPGGGVNLFLERAGGS